MHCALNFLLFIETVMDRSWTYSGSRCSEPFINGVQKFLNFSFERSNVNGKILCPCTLCVNMLYFGRGDILDHLICLWFRPEYLEWVYYGDVTSTTSSSTMYSEEKEKLFHHDIYGIFNDVFQPESGGNGVEIHEATLNSGQEAESGRRTFDNLVNEVKENVVHLYHLKCLNGWSNKSFSMLLEFLKYLLPKGNLLPKTTQQSCPNGCMFFWEEKEKDECCSICGSSRWEVSQDNLENETIPPKKKASKILWWL
ncbi:hypothetical protein LXL04_003841 [Taraxacum kok-saghyz]